MSANQGHYRSGGGKPETRLVLNIAPIEFDRKAEVAVGFFPYEDHDQLKQLRTQYSATHVVRRHRSLCKPDAPNCQLSQIIAIPRRHDAPQIGETSGTITFEHNLGHAAALIRESLIDYLVSVPRKVFQHSPVTFLAEGSHDDLLQKSLPKEMQCPDWLGVNPLFEIDIRVLEFVRYQPFVGMCVNVCTRRQIQRTCQDLLSDGFSIVGRYVGKRVASPDPRIQAQFRLVGKVESTTNGVFRLSDCRADEKEIAASDSYVEMAAFDNLLQHTFREKYPQIKHKLEEQLIAFRNGPALLTRLSALRSYFGNDLPKKTPLEMLPGVQWHCTPFLSQNETAALPKIEKAPTVQYVFDSSGQKTDTWHDRGMDQHGPYSTPTFSPTQPRICVICQKSHKGRIEQFVRKFLHGIVLPEPPQNQSGSGQRQKRQPFTKGFLRKYALQDGETEFFEADDNSAEAYHKAALSAIRAQGERKVRFDLALIEIEEAFHGLRGPLNPYLVTKAEFLSHQIPSQEFRVRDN